MQLQLPRRTVAVAAAVAAALTVSTPAMAAGSKPKPPRFTAEGLVVASTAKTLRVLTRRLKVGTASLPANTVITVRRPPGKSKSATGSLVGYTVTISGSAARSGQTLTLAASTEVAQPQPAEVFLGLVTEITPSGLTLGETSAAGRDDFGTDQRTLTVDASATTTSVDGTAGTVAPGEFAIVLGERDGSNVVAATVDAYTTPPDVEAGRISAITGSAITLGDEWGDGQGGDGQGGDSQGGDSQGGDSQGGDSQGGDGQGGDGTTAADTPAPDANQPTDDTEPGDDQPTVVDLTNVPVVLNGGSTVDVSTLTTGERIVVLGETDPDSGVFTPQIAFAFNRDDRRPATHRHHRDD